MDKRCYGYDFDKAIFNAIERDMIFTESRYGLAPQHIMTREKPLLLWRSIVGGENNKELIQNVYPLVAWYLSNTYITDDTLNGGEGSIIYIKRKRENLERLIYPTSFDMNFYQLYENLLYLRNICNDLYCYCIHCRVRPTLPNV